MKHVIVTGSSSGIGDGLSRYLASRNNRIYGISRKDNFRLRKCSMYSHFYADLTRVEELKGVLVKIREEISDLDLLVLNAGVLGRIADVQEVDVNEMKSIMEINLWANKRVIDQVIALGFKVKQVVAISSGAAISGSRGWNAYALSKAALNMLMQLYAEEVDDIHFSALAPGLVDTNIQAYISDLPEDVRFQTVDRLKAARGTSDMPRPFEVAPRLLKAFDILYSEYPSGAFVDIRDLDIMDK